MPFFVTLCKTLGKPVNFVPVIDKDVRRWWRSDSLWQAHDARYDADQVCIIPGTAAVAGITRLDEPVGELLDRFEQAAIDDVLAAGATPTAVTARRQGRVDVSGPLAAVLDAPDVVWAGRIATNPVHRIADPGEWQVHDGPEEPQATHSSTGARLTTEGDQVVLSVPIAGVWIDIRFQSCPPALIDGGIPVIRTKDTIEAMRSVLAIAAGVDGPDTLLAVVQPDSHRDRALGPRAGRRPHRCHRHLRRAAGANPHHRARRSGRPGAGPRSSRASVRAVAGAASRSWRAC